MNYQTVTLKPGRDVPIRAGHPWVFSEAIGRDVRGEAGMLVAVESAQGEPLGIGTWNGNTSIRVRMLSRDAEARVDADFFADRFKSLNKWKLGKMPSKTDGYRVAHAEADNLPGLIVDRYGDVVVFQLHTAGMEMLREEIVAALKKVFKPKAIVERSDLDVRKIEGLRDQPSGVIYGEVEHAVEFSEAGIKFAADVLRGQKTGFFLDQREARLAVGKLAKGRSMLNLFGYTGAFSVHAALGGAEFVNTVDVSHAALELAQKNFSLNGLDPEDEGKFQFVEADVFDLLDDPKLQEDGYDLIICDPPALAKSQKNLPQAIRAYTELNTKCLAALEPGGILVTSSCSGRVTPEDFRSLLRIAAGRAGKDVRVLDWITQPADHAERLAFPEGRYLKTAVLEVV
ncbi:class I SAM-dependent rRNA methyltransferase [Candidatus Uhrbacteria bacterium]|nr:class I SAM-dependent rRNA methyltransferase [Candidatus Uhrbacteria bacterium]